MRVAMSNSPPRPRVELIVKRPKVSSPRSGEPCSTSLAKVTGLPRL